MKKDKEKPGVRTEAVTHNPFSSLAGKLGTLPSVGVKPEQDEKVREPGKVTRATVRMERKGRGGKEATIVEGLGLGDELLSQWLGELKKLLGCGGAVEGENLVVQGDQRERVVQWLKKKGVGKISHG